jgi:predicted kinase
LKVFVNADKNMSSTLFYELFSDQQEINKAKELKLYEDQSTASDKIYIAVGISGSGKSTYIRENFDSKWIVSSDAIREEICGDIGCQNRNAEVWKEVKKRLVEKISLYGIAVLDATNIDKGRRIKFMSTFNGCKKIALVFPVELNDAIYRVNGDIKNNVNRSNVPTPVIKKQYDTMRRGLKSLSHEFNEVLVMSNESNASESIKVLEEIKSGECK